MDNAQFDKIWNEVQTETNNRSAGAFKRALWYGNNSQVFGQNKGVRKAIRNAPRKVAMGALGAGLGAAAVPPGLSDLITAAVETVLNKGKDVYSSHVKTKIKSPAQSAEEALRKNIKNTVKDLKSNSFQVIDRNLVKLRDSKNKVSPAIQNMMSAQSHISYSSVPSNVPVQTDDTQLEKAHAALRAVAEAQYYTDKITRLVAATQEANERILQDLNTLKAALEDTQSDVTGYVKEYL